MNVVIDGVPYVPDPEWPNKLSVWYMHDNHTFTRLWGTSLDALVEDASRVEREYPYGMLGKAILSRDTKEVRRVGISIHSRGPEHRVQWDEGLVDWRREFVKDAHAMRLLLTNARPTTVFEMEAQ